MLQQQPSVKGSHPRLGFQQVPGQWSRQASQLTDREGRTSKDAHQHLPNESDGFSVFQQGQKTKPRWLPASAAATQGFLPQTSQTHSPSRKRAANHAGLGCPRETVGRRQGDGSQVHSKLSTGNLHISIEARNAREMTNRDKGNTEPVCTPVSQAEVAPHRLSSPTRKLQGREGRQGGDRQVPLWGQLGPGSP